MLAVLASAFAAQAASYEPSRVIPPEPTREFRAAWVATVGNIDWPSQKTLSSQDQKAELLAILNRAAELKLNAIIFQVRPACDALYASRIEPWSEYLTGTMGKAPEPFYDPLTFAIEEAHKRGLELHAWFNPYRARLLAAKSPAASSHISKTKPQLVRHYGEYLWLDPGEKDVQDYSHSVVMDVVKRYDVDGIHFDDYFYPYKVRSSSGGDLDFPDDASWQRYGARGKLSRDDWRRQNVNVFIERVYKSIKSAKPWVKFGVSPFGIWRPKYPPQIQGLRRLRLALRRLARLAGARLGGLLRPAALLGHRPARTKLPRAAPLVDTAEYPGPHRLPGDRLHQGRALRVAPLVAAAGNRQPDSPDSQPGRHQRPDSLEHEEPHAQCRLR